MARYLLHLLLPLLMLQLAACSGDTPEEPPTTAPRTILVYMVANNSLGQMGYDTLDIREMCRAAATGGFGDSRLIIYHNNRRQAPTLYEISPETATTVELKRYDPTIASVSASRMADVIADTKKFAPADRYGIILWSHGSGWLENGLEEPDTNTTTPADNRSSNTPDTPLDDTTPSDISIRSFGDDGGRHMNVTTLARVLQDQNFDFVYFDCCEMAGIEVAYQLRNATDYIIGSATELPLDGMPYDLTIPILLRPEPDLPEAARQVFEYYNALSGADRTCTISVIRTDALDRLADTTRSIYAASSPDLPADFRPQPFTDRTCVIFDFEQYVEAICPDPALLAQFRNALSAAVIYKNQTPYIWATVPILHHCGLSTYILRTPDDALYRNYQNLAWYHDVASLLFN